MRLGILNSELGIAVIDGIEDLGYIQTQQIMRQIPEGTELNDLAFFYMSDRDWIVINKNNYLYWYYSEIIQIYLELSAESRKECIAKAPTATVKSCLRMLDSVIRYRALIYGNEV